MHVLTTWPRVSVATAIALALGVTLPIHSDADAKLPEGKAVAAQVALSSCYTTDNGFPDLSGVTVSPSKLDVRRHDRWLTVTARPVDDGGPGPATGITEVGVELGRLGSPAMAPQADGSWVGRIRVPRGVKPGTYGVRSVRLRDAGDRIFGHVRDFYFSRPEAEQMGASVQVVAEQDRRAPTLRWLQTSATSVDVTARAARIRVRARVTDDAAGVASASLLTDGSTSAQLRLRRGTARDGVWAGTLTVPRWMRDRSVTHNLLFSATDRPGNELFIYWDELGTRGMPSTLTVRTRRPDRDDPRVRKVSLAPAVVDLTDGDRPVTATVHATDAGAGVRRASFFSRQMPRVAGDRHRGEWRRTIMLDHCVWRTDDVRLEVGVSDRASNGVTVRQPISIVNRNDIRAPYPSLTTPEEAGPTDPVTYRFNEDVVGISSTSAPVRPTWPGVAFGHGDPPPAVPGAWSCRSSAGTSVDCVSGQVRTATWTPDAPLTPGQSYGVDFNPEHVLDVLDLAGNPIDLTLRLEDEYAPTWTIR
jgi:hypothetical protein